MQISHPYFENIRFLTAQCCEVKLSSAFPIRSFKIRTIPSGTGYVEAKADVRFVESDGTFHDFYGGGETFDDACYSVVSTFLNTIVSPEDLNEENFTVARGVA